MDGDSVEVGTNVDYAVYVHEGTGKYAIGGGTPKERWVYRDELTGEFRMGYPQRPRRFIKNAIERYTRMTTRRSSRNTSANNRIRKSAYSDVPP